MAISRDQVLHVAKLARLHLAEAEVDKLTQELGAILTHVDQLQAVDTADVPPTEYLAVEALPLREDVPTAGVTHDEALAPAPSTLHEGFRVPAFVDD